MHNFRLKTLFLVLNLFILIGQGNFNQNFRFSLFSWFCWLFEMEKQTHGPILDQSAQIIVQKILSIFHSLWESNPPNQWPGMVSNIFLGGTLLNNRVFHVFQRKFKNDSFDKCWKSARKTRKSSLELRQSWFFFNWILWEQQF